MALATVLWPWALEDELCKVAICCSIVNFLSAAMPGSNSDESCALEMHSALLEKILQNCFRFWGTIRRLLQQSIKHKSVLQTGDTSWIKPFTFFLFLLQQTIVHVKCTFFIFALYQKLGLAPDFSRGKTFTFKLFSLSATNAVANTRQYWANLGNAADRQ